MSPSLQEKTKVSVPLGVIAAFVVAGNIANEKKTENGCLSDQP